MAYLLVFVAFAGMAIAAFHAGKENWQSFAYCSVALFAIGHGGGGGGGAAEQLRQHLLGGEDRPS